MREHQGRRHLEGSAGLRHRRARAWFLIAFAFLASGVMAGASWHTRDWSWVFPAGGFVAYVLAFRRALRVGRAKSLDDIWRLPSLTTGPGWVQRRGGWRREGKVDRWDFRKGPRSGNRRPSDVFDSRRQG